MKKIFTLLLAVCLGTVYGQKRTITSETYKDWPKVGGGNLTNNGKYAYYRVENEPNGHSTLKVVKTTGQEIFTAIDVNHPRFSGNSEYLFIACNGDSLLRYNLVTNEKQYFYGVARYEVQSIVDRERLILYDKSKTLKVLDLDGKEIFSAQNVIDYKFSPSGRNLLLQSYCTKDSSILNLLDAERFLQVPIYNGRPISTFTLIFDEKENQLAFFSNEEGKNNIHYFRKGDQKAIRLVSGSSGHSDLRVDRGRYWRFSKDGQRIYFSLNEIKKEKTPNPLNLVISSYEDNYTESFVAKPENFPAREYLSYVNISDQTVHQLLKDYETVADGTFNVDTDTIAVIQSLKGDPLETWNIASRSNYYLLNTVTGMKKPILKNHETLIPVFTMSPDGKYLAYIDHSSKTVVSYDVRNNTTRDLLVSTFDEFERCDKEHYPLTLRFDVNMLGWAGKDAIILNAKYDLWRFDVCGVKAPINLTGGIGKSKKIVFSLFEGNYDRFFKSDEQVLIFGINSQSKDFGFYSISLAAKDKFKELSSGPDYFGEIFNSYSTLSRNDLIGNRTSGYLIKRERASKGANFYYSKDLVSFKQISNYQPHKSYNWLSSSLHTYKDKFGRELQGVLYKPESLDTSIKYPVIFNYYEIESYVLNKFQYPDPTGGDLNIPLMVNNGYLVFLIDTKSSPGNPGEGVLNSINAARAELSKYSWVDTSKIGLIGGSWGGFQTNYVVTHSDNYAAAISYAGVSNMTVAATSNWGSGIAKQNFYMTTAYMLLKPLTDDPSRYIENSPVLLANKVTTPILFIHNDPDENVPVQHSRSMFGILRTLGKPCWWLNYKGEGHAIADVDKMIDYQNKVLDFYGHFLKGNPKSSWMKEHN